MRDKSPKNAKGQRHGIWVGYHDNGKLWFKGTYINSIRQGPWEQYHTNGQLMYKVTYILGQRDGLFQWYYLNGSLKEITFYVK
jgi:antitoxin component YwqK of YwqJK toxin-antitoxin module